MHRKTKIVVTLGPAIDDESKLLEIFKIANIARFNFSHGNHDEHKTRLKKIRKIEEELGKVITAMADLKGPEIRTANKEELNFNKGDVIEFWQDLPLTINEMNLDDYLRKGDDVFIADGTIKAKYKGNNKIELINDAKITPKRKVNFPFKDIPLDAVSEKDKEDLKFIKAQGFDVVAQSFVKTSNDVEIVNKLVNMPIIAKMEHIEGYKNLASILDKPYVIGVMVARGDLGVEASINKLPIMQKEMVKEAKQRNKLVIIATHMLKSMVNNPLPTRAEINDVANAVFDGADAVMLSDETSVGKFPIEAVNTMHKAVLESESYIKNNNESKALMSKSYKSVIAYSASNLSNQLDLPLISPTQKGSMPIALSMLKPYNIIFSPTTDIKTARILNLYYAINPKVMQYEPLLNNYKAIKKAFNIRKGVFVFTYPREEKKPNTILII